MGGRGSTFKLFTIAGIRVGVDGSWFLILFLAIFWLSRQFRGPLGGDETLSYLTGLATALLFFASLLAHELGHAFVAKRAGIDVPRIDLWMLGGMARMSRDPATPVEEFKISAAGPAVSLLVAAVCVGTGIALDGPSTALKTIGLSEEVKVTPQFLALSVLSTMNILIFVFNLLPAWPLDGGRITRAIAWRVTGSKVRATVFSARLGRGLGWLLAALGLWMIFAGSVFTGAMWMLLAFFIGQSAKGAMLQSEITERAHGRTVMELMDRHPVTLPASTPADEAAEDWFDRYGWSWFAVVDDAGRFIGIANEEEVRAAGDLPGLADAQPVGELIDPATASGCTVDEATPLEDLVTNESLGRNGFLMAVDEFGILRGVITVEQVRAALIARSG